jgi:phosphoglycerol transferase MdoB-like AlkP superfamily enzyme
MQLKFGRTKISPTRRQWIALALGIVLIALGSLGVPLIYRLILLSDLFVLTGLMLAFIAIRQFEWKGLPAIDVLDGFVVSGLIIFFVVAVAYMSYNNYSSSNLTTVFRLAISAEALGGLIHEVFQSGGKFAMPQLQQPQNKSKSQEKSQNKSQVDSQGA